MQSTSPYICFEYTGGEPTINMDVIRFIVEYAKEKNQTVKKKIEHSVVTNMTYMNEELMLARDQIRKRREDTKWFIPVKISQCEIPDLEIGAGQSIRDFQWVDLSNQWDDGITAIVASINRR